MVIQALDRYQVIVNPTRETCKPIRTIVILSFIWTTAIILASPLFIFRTVESVHVSKYHIYSLRTLGLYRSISSAFPYKLG